MATAAGVELAVLHNFLWHDRTWRDRGNGRRFRIGRFMTYQLATGTTSIVGNVGIVALTMRFMTIDAAAANMVAVGAMSVANYLIADRWVFAPHALTTRC